MGKGLPEIGDVGPSSGLDLEKPLLKRGPGVWMPPCVFSNGARLDDMHIGPRGCGLLLSLWQQRGKVSSSAVSIPARGGNRLCRKFAFGMICAMVSLGDLPCTERESDDGDQFQ